jgi:hypothetical protein
MKKARVAAFSFLPALWQKAPAFLEYMETIQERAFGTRS